MEQLSETNLPIVGRIQHGLQEIVNNKKRVKELGYFIAKTKNDRLAGQLDVFDAGKAGAVALDHIRQVVIAVHTGKDAGSERPVPCCLQKRDRFFLSVAVEIGQLHRLLIRAGHRRRIDSALAAQNRIDCKLQPVIFIRMPRQRI